MKLTPPHVSKNGRCITAWRAVFGSRKARMLGLIDEKGRPVEFIAFPFSGGIMCAPKREYVKTIENGEFSADIYKIGSVFFGEIPSLPNSPSFWGSPIEKAEASFRKIVADHAFPL